MQVDDLRRAGPFVKVVHVLGDDGHVEVFLQFGDDLVGAVGQGLLELAPALVVELEHKALVAVPSFDVGHVGHVVVFPQAVAVAEGLDPALGAYTGAG